MNKSILLRILNILFCLTFVLVITLYANLGKLVNSFLDPEFIKQSVNKNTGLVLDLANPEISTTKDFCINLKSASVKFLMPDANNNTLLYIKDIDAKIKIFPLIFKKLEFKKITSSNLEINLERAKDGEFNFLKYFKNDKNLSFKVSAKNASLLVDKYIIHYTDKFLGTGAEILGSDLISTEFDLDTSAYIKTKGSLKLISGNKVRVSPYAVDLKLKFPLNKNLDFEDLKLELSIANIDFSYLEPYLKEISANNIKSFKGNGDIIITPSKTLKNALFLKLDIKNLYANIFKNNHDNIINISDKSTILLTTHFKKDEIYIDDFNFKKDKINISVDGVLKNIPKLTFGENINFNSIVPDINLKIKDTSLHEGLLATPDYFFKLQQDYIPNLKKYNANAVVNGEFKVKERFRYPDMYGYIKLDDVYLLERPSNAKTSSAVITFNGSDVDIDVDANCPEGQKLIVKGKTEIKELPVAKFNIQSSPSVDIAFAHRILIPIHKIFGFQLGPLPFMKVSGNGEISLKTEGTRESANLNGYFKTQNGRASLQGLNTELYNGNLNLIFKGKKIIFDNTTGIAEGAKVKIDGSSDVNGNLDLYVNIYDAEASRALNIVKTSDMLLTLLNGGGFLDAYTNPKGNIDFNMHLWGKAEPVTGDTMNFEPNDNMHSKGTITFKNNSIDIFPEIKASKINGTLDFTDFVTLDLNADIYSSPFNLTGTIKPDASVSKNRALQPQIIDLTFKTKSASSGDLYKFFYDNQEGFQSKNKISDELYDFLNKINFKFAANIRAKGSVEPGVDIIDMKKFNLNGWAVGLNYKESDVKFNSGDVKFQGQKLLFKNLNTVLWDADVITNGEIDKIFDDTFLPDLNFKLVSFPFAKIGDLSTFSNDKNIKKVLNDYTDFKGSLNGEFIYNSSGFKGSTSFNQVSLYDKKRELPVDLNSGNIRFSNNQIRLNALNMSYGHTPVYLDAILDDFTLSKPKFNVFVSTNLNEESLDKLLNPMLQFPLKTKGEFMLKGRLRGQADNYTTFATLNLDPGADLYYMGANLGDTSNKREISARIDFKNDEVDIKNLKYLKYINSQNNVKETPYDMLRVSGAIKTDDKNLLLDNLSVLTPNPAPARLLNSIFKKSILKQGTFNAQILLNGILSKPNARGKVKFSNIDIPLYETQIRDVDLTLNDDLIHAVFEGTGMKSDVKITAEIINKPTLPVIINNAEISSRVIDLNSFTKGLSKYAKSQKSPDPAAKQAFVLSPSDLEIKNGKLLADEIYFNNIKAKNFSGTFKHTKEGVFVFDDLVFDIAGGKIKTSGSYEFDTTKYAVNSVIEECDANTLATDILGAKNMIFGKTNGKISLSGRELNTSGGINKVEANVDFAIHDGKMPKLGSLEYLLRAGNLVKSGILGFTLNNVIEVLIPYKTGEFKKISGDFVVEDGKIDKLNLYSRGDNLSIYTTGTYDIASNIGNFEVLGKLSTKISNLLGPIGNASVNSIVNLFHNGNMDKNTREGMFKNTDKIPDIAGGSSEFRLFAVRILGDLNADNFVKSFNWLN